MKIILVLIAMISLVACSQSSDSKGGEAPVGRAEKLTDDISFDIIKFVIDEQAFGWLINTISSDVSGDNTFSKDALPEIRENCQIESFQYNTADVLHSHLFKLTGSRCPLLADSKILDWWPPKDLKDFTTEWSNSYIVQSIDYRKKYGFFAITVKNKIDYTTADRRYKTWDYSYRMADGSVVKATFTADFTTPQSKQSVVFTMNNNTIEASSIYIYGPPGKREFICKFNGVNLEESQCAQLQLEKFISARIFKWRVLF